MANPLDTTSPLNLNWMQSLPGGLNSWTAGGGNPFSPKDALPSTTIGSGYGPMTPGGAPSGGMTPGGGTTGSNIAGAAGALTPLLGSLLASSNPAEGNASANTGRLTSLAQSLFGTGTNFLTQGQQALTPVLQYLKAVAGGDPGALLGATQPQRARVIDQYDTAKRGDQFLPRGGGQTASAMARSTQEASDLSTISADARTAGVNELGTLGQNLAQLGLSATTQGTNDLNNSIQAYEQQAKFAAQQSSQTGAAIGKSISAAMPFIMAAFA
jgi:hypothetical protein